MWRWSTLQNFFLAVTDELGKQTFKNCWSGPIKKQNNLIFTMLHFLQKSKKKIFFWENKKKTPGEIIMLHVYQKLWSHDVRFLRYGARLTDGRTKWHIYRWVPHVRKCIKCASNPPPPNKNLQKMLRKFSELSKVTKLSKF